MPDEDVARLLDSAASQARTRGAPDSAGELQERAGAAHSRRGTPAGADRRAIAAAEHFFHAGDLPRARTLLERTLGGRDRPGSARGECLRDTRVSSAATRTASLTEFRCSRRRCCTCARSGLGIQIRLDLAFAHLSVGDKQQARAHVQEALSRAEQLGETGLLARALAFDAIIGYQCGFGIDRAKIDRALELEDPSRPVRLMWRPASIAAMLAVSDGGSRRRPRGSGGLGRGARAGRGERATAPAGLSGRCRVAAWALRRCRRRRRADPPDLDPGRQRDDGGHRDHPPGDGGVLPRSDRVGARRVRGCVELMERHQGAPASAYVRMGKGLPRALRR